MVEFNQIQGNQVAPIFAFEISSGGQFENQARLLLIGHKASAGSMSDNEPLLAVSGTEVRALAGQGSILDDMYRAARSNAATQEIWIMSVPPSGTAQIVDVTISGTPAAGQGVLQIAGERVVVDIAAGDTVTEIAAAMADAINGYFNEFTGASLPYTASAAAGVITLTARHLGIYANEIDIYVPTSNNSLILGTNIAVAQDTAGAGSPTLTDAIAAMGDDEFDWIVPAFTDSTNVTLYKDLLSEVSGRWRWDRQIYGHVMYALLDTTSNLTTHGLAQDDKHTTVIPMPSGAGNAEPSWVWAAAFAGRVVPWLSDGANGNVSRNQTGLQVASITAPRDRTKWLDITARNAYLVSGLSTWKVSNEGNVVVDKLITTDRTTNGVPDTTFRDIQKIGQLMYVLRKFRTDLSFQHGQKSIADDNPFNVQSVSTPADIKATILHSYQQMVATGVLENAVDAADQIIVQRNADNPNRVDVYAPIDTVNPLDIIATLVKVFSQFNNAD